MMLLYQRGTYLTMSTVGGPRRTSSTSTTTINQFRSSREPSRTETPTTEGREQQRESSGRRPSAIAREQPPGTSFLQAPPLAEEDPMSSSAESESDDNESGRPRPRFKRLGKFSAQRAGLRDDEDDDDDAPAFLPLPRQTEKQGSRQRPGQEVGAAQRLEAEQAGRSTAEQRPTRGMPVTTESSASSVSSGVPVALPQGESRRTSQAPEGLSPRRAGEVTRLSPRKSTASGREASDGTPSMGSSFSDLDGKSHCP